MKLVHSDGPSVNARVLIEHAFEWGTCLIDRHDDWRRL